VAAGCLHLDRYHQLGNYRHYKPGIDAATSNHFKDAHSNTPKMAFDWLAPILTPAALRSVQADGRPVIALFLVIFGLSVFGVLIWYIHFVTSKMYPKKKDPKAKKRKLLGFIKR
jgi:hypothetical protein